MEKLRCSHGNAEKFRAWIDRRGGIAVWQSINLSNPGTSWSTPARTEAGEPMGKPTWQAAGKPERIITDPADVIVETAREVRRFHVGIRRSGNGLQLKCTDGSTRRIRAACARAGEKSWYEFDYCTQEAVIFVPEKEIPLPDYKDTKGE